MRLRKGSKQRMLCFFRGKINFLLYSLNSASSCCHVVINFLPYFITNVFPKRFIEVIGVFVYYALSRWCHQIPFTAIMFLIGFCIGFCVDRVKPRNILLESSYIWTNIEGELIILIFLPGLLYLDSFNIDIHLFLQSFWQLVVFAFPMVLGGTALTALVAYYIFPYGWSFDLCMTFGSILSGMSSRRPLFPSIR